MTRAEPGRMAKRNQHGRHNFAFVTRLKIGSFNLSNKKTTTKKSKASSVHPKNEAVTAWNCPALDRPATPLSRSLLNNTSSQGLGGHALRNIMIKHRAAHC